MVFFTCHLNFCHLQPTRDIFNSSAKGFGGGASLWQQICFKVKNNCMFWSTYYLLHLVSFTAAGVHKEYIQPPAAHTTREAIAVSTREQHLLAAAQAKTWTTATASGAHPALHQGYRHSSAHLSPQPLAHAAAASRLSPQHPLAAAGQPLYHQPELYRRPAVYVTTAQPAYLPASHQVAPFTAGWVKSVL